MKTHLKSLPTLRQRRIFSLEVKKQIVQDIEDGKCSVAQASYEIAVCKATIYRWLELYSRYLKRNQILVVQNKSDAFKTKELQKRILELEAKIGRLSLENEVLSKLIELAGEELDMDLKKSFDPGLFDGSKPTKPNKKKS